MQEDLEKKLAAAQGELDGAAAVRRAAERQVRELELRLNGVMAAKARGEKEMQQRQEVRGPPARECFAPFA